MNYRGLILSAAPDTEPFTTEELKTYLRVDHSDEDTLIGTILEAARLKVEELTGQALYTQTWELWLDRFPFYEKENWWDGVRDGVKKNLVSPNGHIELPIYPVQSITAINHYDDDNTESTVDSGDYILDDATKPSRVVLHDAKTWPSGSLRAAKGVKITFVSGRATVGAIPAALKMAVLQLCGHYYEHRGDVDQPVPKTIRSLLRPYRIIRL